jgi:hypothetical protein
MSTRAYVKLCAMERAREQRSTHPTFGELRVTMRTVINYRVKRTGHSTHDDTVFAQFGEHSNLAVAQTAQVTKLNESRHRQIVAARFMFQRNARPLAPFIGPSFPARQSSGR